MSIAHINRAAPNGATTANSTSLTTTAANHATGNFIVCHVNYQPGGSFVSSVTDTAGNTYYKALSNTIVNANGHDIWYAYNIIGNASNIITAAIGGGGTIYGSIAADCFSGMGTVDPLVSITYKETGDINLSPTALATPTIEVGSTDALIYCAVNAGSTGLTAGTGYTLTSYAVSGDSNAYFGDQWKLVSANEAPNATCSAGGGGWGINAVAFSANGVKPSTPYYRNHAQPNGATTGSVSSLATKKMKYFAGGLVVVRIGYQSGSSVTSITDTDGNTFHNIFSAAASSNNRTDLWYAYNVSAGDDKIISIALGSNTTYGYVSAMLFGGFSTSDPLGATDSATSSSSAVTTGTISITSANALIYAAIIANNGVHTAGTGFTLSSDVVSGDGRSFFADEYQVVTVGTAAAFTSDSNGGAIYGVAFNQATASGITLTLSLLGVG